LNSSTGFRIGVYSENRVLHIKAPLKNTLNLLFKEEVMAGITGNWYDALKGEFKKPYYRELYNRVNQEYQSKKIFPAPKDIFNAFHLTPLEEVKVVILGQDPYHGEGQAHGLCFSVQKGIVPPPSLVNIYKELHDDLGFKIPNHGNLTEWAKQGVLLLNTVLTVQAHMANSHREIGWERFTDAVIQVVDEQKRPVVFLLWGAPAGRKAALLNNPLHLILKAPHPSPLAAHRGFFGCKHFSQVNRFLTNHNVEPVNWEIR
jgi:uracil-DNA glycosylase